MPARLRGLVRQPASDVLAGGRHRAGAAAGAGAAGARRRRRCSRRPPRGRTSRPTTARRASRWAVIRWRCCASSWPRRASSPRPQLRELPHGRVVRVAGIVTARQRPQSAGGVMFVTLEDETGYVNLIVWERVWSRARRVGQQFAAAGGARAVAEGRAASRTWWRAGWWTARRCWAALRHPVARFPLSWPAQPRRPSARSSCAPRCESSSMS